MMASRNRTEKERHEFGVAGKLHARSGAGHDRHHVALRRIIGFEHGAEIMVVAEIGDVRQGPAHHVAALDPLALEADWLDPEQRFHRVRQRRAAEHLAGGNAATQTGFEFHVVGGEDVPAERVLAPHAE
jgi:hypothetical protein